MASTNAEANLRAVQTAADAYLDLPVETLEELFERAISDLDADSQRYRGTGWRFWNDARKRLAREVAKQQLAASATAGLAASHVLQWADRMGLDLNDYRVPISIMVALIVRSIWEEMDNNKERGEGS